MMSRSRSQGTEVTTVTGAFSKREVFNVGFLNSGVTRSCLNAGGKMPVRRDVLMMCVSAGRSVGEIAWRRCERDWI